MLNFPSCVTFRIRVFGLRQTIVTGHPLRHPTFNVPIHTYHYIQSLEIVVFSSARKALRHNTTGSFQAPRPGSRGPIMNFASRVRATGQALPCRLELMIRPHMFRNKHTIICKHDNPLKLITNTSKHVSSFLVTTQTI